MFGGNKSMNLPPLRLLEKHGTPALRIVARFRAGISWLTLTSSVCSSSYGSDVELKRTAQKREKVMFSQVQILGLKATYDSGIKNTGEKDLPLIIFIIRDVM